MAEIGQYPGGGRPWGDIITVQTPYTDQTVQRLYQEQRMREQQQRQENQLLDSQFQKELGKVRSVDTPDIINAYQQYKDLKKKLLFDPAAKKDPLAYNQLQQQAQLAYANALKASNKSAELNELGKNLLTDRIKNPNNYVDQFGGLLSQFQNTPLSQGGKIKDGEREIDLFSPDTYLYKGGNFDLGKAMQSAAGTPRPTYSFEEPVGKEQLQVKVTPFSFGNKPGQVKDSLLGTFAQRDAGRSAAYQWDQLPQGEFEKVAQSYAQMSPDKLKRMGLENIQDVMPRNPQNKAENYASYLAMKYALDNEPIMGAPQFRTNQENLLNRQLADRKEMEKLRRGNQESLARLRASLKGASVKEAENWLTNFVDDTFQEARSVGPIKYQTKDGKQTDTYELKLSDAIKKELGNKDAYRLTPDGDIMFFDYERYPKGSKEGTEGEVIETKDGRRPIQKGTVGRMSTQEFKALVGKKLIGIKALNQALDSEDFDDNEEESVDIENLRNTYKY